MSKVLADTNCNSHCGIGKLGHSNESASHHSLYKSKTWYNGIVKVRTLHPWHVSVDEAKVIQRRLAPMVSCVSAIPDKVRHLAGVDISPPDSGGTVRAAVVVLRYPGLELEEVTVADGKPGLPYIPGLLSFRETPVIIDALGALDLTPDIIIADGQGLAHPRSFGIACHIGLLTDTPTIGCAKSILTGKHGPLGAEAGSRTPLMAGKWLGWPSGPGRT